MGCNQSSENTNESWPENSVVEASSSKSPGISKSYSSDGKYNEVHSPLNNLDDLSTKVSVTDMSSSGIANLSNDDIHASDLVIESKRNIESFQVLLFEREMKMASAIQSHKSFIDQDRESIRRIRKAIDCIKQGESMMGLPHQYNLIVDEKLRTEELLNKSIADTIRAHKRDKEKYRTTTTELKMQITSLQAQLAKLKCSTDDSLLQHEEFQTNTRSQDLPKSTASVELLQTQLSIVQDQLTAAQKEVEALRVCVKEQGDALGDAAAMAALDQAQIKELTSDKSHLQDRMSAFIKALKDEKEAHKSTRLQVLASPIQPSVE